MPEAWPSFLMGVTLGVILGAVIGSLVCAMIFTFFANRGE